MVRSHLLRPSRPNNGVGLMKVRLLSSRPSIVLRVGIKVDVQLPKSLILGVLEYSEKVPCLT